MAVSLKISIRIWSFSFPLEIQNCLKELTIRKTLNKRKVLFCNLMFFFSFSLFLFSYFSLLHNWEIFASEIELLFYQWYFLSVNYNHIFNLSQFCNQYFAYVLDTFWKLVFIIHEIQSHVLLFSISFLFQTIFYTQTWL